MSAFHLKGTSQEESGSAENAAKRRKREIGDRLILPTLRS
jgi:hypothetical protein